MMNTTEILIRIEHPDMLEPMDVVNKLWEELRRTNVMTPCNVEFVKIERTDYNDHKTNASGLSKEDRGY